MGNLETEICRSEKYECIGLDLNKSFVKLALRRLKLHGYKNASFVLGDLRNLPFRTRRFHYAVLHDVAAVVNIKSIIGEIARMLKSGGRFVFDVPLTTFYRLIPVQRPFVKYSRREITSALKKKGLKEECIFLLGTPPVLHERFNLPVGLTRGLSMFFMSFPKRLQELIGDFWYAVIFVARYDLQGAENAQVA
jgi:SAM-dependent methyltransferase